jgi:site-specific DNA recombinase
VLPGRSWNGCYVGEFGAIRASDCDLQGDCHPQRDGVTDLDDVLKGRLSNIKAERDRAKRLRTCQLAGRPDHSDRSGPHRGVWPPHASQSDERLGAFRKAYLRSIVDAVEVDEERIRIKCSKDVLERAIFANAGPGYPGSQMSTRWRAAVDENGQYSFAVAL